ncbi:MAG TPA: DUF481 domain-containing protein [Gammaproteobacteria bacterium]|nr:DUF481 domain-containing protein [Gammaproteobacteria bacterium]
MRQGSIIFTALLVFYPVVPVMARDYGWFGSVALGAVVTSGNTDTSSLNGALKERYQGKQWLQKFEASLLQSRSDNNLSAERYLGDYKLTYKLYPQIDFFMDVRVVRDEFAGFNRQYFETIGYGHRWIEALYDVLDLELGVGLLQQQSASGDSQANTVLRAGFEYQHKFINGNKFSWDLLVLGARDNTNTHSKLAVKAKLFAALAAEISVTGSYNSNVPADKESQDITTSMGLVYDF